eukprot:SAG22_NODE_662_length_8055_cov_5.450980_9_plen_66_part_01
MIYYTRQTVEERLLAARRANGDFDRDNSDNADNLSVTRSAVIDLTKPDRPAAAAAAGGGGGGGGGG